MVAHGRVELLAHPLSQKYLQMKWNAYGKYFHVCTKIIFVILLIILSLNICFSHLGYEPPNLHGFPVFRNAVCVQTNE